MRSRRPAQVVVLVAAAGCVVYLAMGAYVRGTSEKSVSRAALSLQHEEPAEARQALRWLLWFEPDHPAALHLTALSYLQEQNLSAAIGSLERIDVRSPVQHDAQLDLSTALLADRQFERAETVLGDYLQRYPKSLLARRQLSGLFLTGQRQREAVQVLEELLDPSLPATLTPSDQLLLLRDLATAEFHPPAMETCRSTLEAALHRHPDQPGVRVSLAECLLELGDTNGSRRLLEDALRQQPEDPRIRFLNCLVQIEIGDLDAAESSLMGDAAGIAFESDDRYWELQCRIAERRGDFEQALALIERAIDIRPSDSDYESRRARLLQRLGRADDARHAYARSHELARAELDLWDLSRELGVRTPNAAECERVAQLYELPGRSRPAAAWRHFAQQLASTTVPPEAAL